MREWEIKLETRGSIMLEKLKNHTPTLVGIARSRKFAVCIPLVKRDTGWHLLFEVRSTKIGRQPGDICFPGGMLEAGETPEEAAVRESCEELIVEEDQLQVIAPMDILVEDGGMIIYTYAAELKDYRGTMNPAEVSQVFTVPLEYLLAAEPELYYTTEYTVPDENFPFDRIRGGKAYPWRKKREEMFFYTWKNWVIWGITARILEAFLQVCR